MMTEIFDFFSSHHSFFTALSTIVIAISTTAVVYLTTMLVRLTRLHVNENKKLIDASTLPNVVAFLQTHAGHNAAWTYFTVMNMGGGLARDVNVQLINGDLEHFRRCEVEIAYDFKIKYRHLPPGDRRTYVFSEKASVFGLITQGDGNNLKSVINNLKSVMSIEDTNEKYRQLYVLLPDLFALLPALRLVMRWIDKKEYNAMWSKQLNEDINRLLYPKAHNELNREPISNRFRHLMEREDRKGLDTEVERPEIQRLLHAITKYRNDIELAIDRAVVDREDRAAFNPDLQHKLPKLDAKVTYYTENELSPKVERVFPLDVADIPPTARASEDAMPVIARGMQDIVVSHRRLSNASLAVARYFSMKGEVEGSQREKIE